MRRAIISDVVGSRLAVASLLLGVAACSGTPGTFEQVGSTSQAINGATILSRAEQWVTAQLLYCQSPNGASDTIDPSCPTTCVRQTNTAWDPYRSDCSGFISWAWGLPAPGYTTSDLAPADTSVSYVINGSDLQPGDALNIPGDHIVLFVSWVTMGSEANFYEEPGCSATPNYAHAFSSAVTLSGSSVTIAYEGETFTAIRYVGLGTDAGVVAGTLDGSSAPDTAHCYSDTLGVTVPVNTCVQSVYDNDWYQCDDGGSWVDRYTDPAACASVYPLGSVYDAGIDAGVDSGKTSTVDSGTDAGTKSGVDAESTATADAGHDASEDERDAGHDASSGSGLSDLDSGIASSRIDASTRDAASPAKDAAVQALPPETAPAGSSGCSVSASSKSNRVDGAWLFGLAVVSISRRRRRCRL